MYDSVREMVWKQTFFRNSEFLELMHGTMILIKGKTYQHLQVSKSCSTLASYSESF